MTAENLKFAGKTAVVTGAGQGIGRAIALNLAESGADIGLVVRSSVDKAAAVADEIQRLGRRVFVYKADIADEKALEAAMAAAAVDLGRIDVLVNNAGAPGTRGLALHELSTQQWRAVIDVNIHGTYFACRSVIPRMIAASGGAIINVSSIAALRPLAFWGSYSISKIGVVMLTRQLALELAQYGIRVNAVAPGLIATPRTESSLSDPELVTMRMPGLPFGRPGQPAEIAEIVSFLASGHASYITGQIVVADGGESDAWPIRTALAKRTASAAPERPASS